ncbi:MAG: hypothetical protein Q9202_004867 [Teloschistes flavicans]
MAHVLEQTLASKPSHESFHSTHSEQTTSSILSSPSNQLTTDLHTAASHAAGVPVVSIEHYLNNTPVSSEPVQLGAPRTSHNVPMLHQLCQERGLVAEYEIDGGQAEGFCGSVTVGQEVISSERRCPNKKEAKEALAELAVPVVKDMVAVGREKKAAGGEQERNWIGTLLGRSILNGFFSSSSSSSSSSSVGYLGLSQYHNALDPTHTSPGPTYTEYALGLHFACTCTLHATDPTDAQIPSPASFGSPTIPFTTKKAARNNAAKEAVRHLISTGGLNDDGSVKTRKKGAKVANGGPTVRIEPQHGAVEVQKASSFAARVHDLVVLLGLQPPTYRFSPASPATPVMLSGAAYFDGDAGMGQVHAGLHGPVGEVRNVHGKKNAKEECAKAVWGVLRGVARERGVEVPEAE